MGRAVVRERARVAGDGHCRIYLIDGLRKVITHIVVADAVARLEGSRDRHAVGGNRSGRACVGVGIGIRAGGRHSTCRQRGSVLQRVSRNNRRADIVVRHQGRSIVVLGVVEDNLQIALAHHNLDEFLHLSAIRRISAVGCCGDIVGSDCFGTTGDGLRRLVVTQSNGSELRRCHRQCHL